MILITHLAVSGLLIGLAGWAVFVGIIALVQAMWMHDEEAFVMSLSHVLLAYVFLYLLRFSWPT